MGNDRYHHQVVSVIYYRPACQNQSFYVSGLQPCFGMRPCSLEKCFSCHGSVLRVSGEATNIERAFRDVLSICLQFLHSLKYLTFFKMFKHCKVSGKV